MLGGLNESSSRVNLGMNLDTTKVMLNKQVIPRSVLSVIPFSKFSRICLPIPYYSARPKQR